MAYGQTGSGKTYTILGPAGCMKNVKSDEIKPEFGLFPRSALNIFKTISGNLAAKKQVMTFSLIECSFMKSYDML